MQTEKIIPGKLKKFNAEFLEQMYKVKDKINAFEKNCVAFENIVYKMKFNDQQNSIVHMGIRPGVI